MLRYRSYAKINLYLDVLQPRPDGYHNIETIFQSVGLYDTLEFSANDEGAITLDCSRDDLGEAEKNLAYRAAALLKERASVAQGMHIKLEKCIPVAAGLAGGSGNAAATLLACDQLWGLGYPVEKLCTLGATLGADVPFCIRGGTMAATGIGEELHPLPPMPELWVVLVHPEISISTPWVYKHPDLEKNPEVPELKTGDKLHPFPATSKFRNALCAYNRGAWKELVFNRMESVVFAEYPQLAAYKKRLLDAGCIAAAMSGSGSTVFGICENENSASAIAGTFEAERVSCSPVAPCGVTEIK